MLFDILLVKYLKIGLWSTVFNFIHSNRTIIKLLASFGKPEIRDSRRVVGGGGGGVRLGVGR